MTEHKTDMLLTVDRYKTNPNLLRVAISTPDHDQGAFIDIPADELRRLIDDEVTTGDVPGGDHAHGPVGVYLAAPYVCRDALRAHAADLVDLGFECTSTWLDESVEVHSGTTGAATAIDDHAAARHVAQDIADVGRSSVLVLFTWSASAHLASHLGGNSGGRHVETGIAIANGTPVVVVGPPENIFHRGAGVTVVPDWPSALAAILVASRRGA